MLNNVSTVKINFTSHLIVYDLGLHFLKFRYLTKTNLFVFVLLKFMIETLNFTHAYALH